MIKRTLKKLYSNFLHIPKYAKLPDKVFHFRVAFSLLTILACIVVMVSSTFALFYMDISTDNSTIASAYYSVKVDMAENDIYICPLVYEDKHSCEIIADGTASTGYCKIQVGEQVYYTDQIPQGASLLLTIQAAKDTIITFAPQWGELSNYVNENICGNEIIHSTTPYTYYKVEPTAKLADIAMYYGVSEADILIYNNISEIVVADILDDNSTIQLAVGKELKIPGVADNVIPYAVPYATYIVEPYATLENISLYYDVSVEDILMYNNISELTVGFELRIPGVSPDTVTYVAPVRKPLNTNTVSGGDAITSNDSASGNDSVSDKDSVSNNNSVSGNASAFDNHSVSGNDFVSYEPQRGVRRKQYA